MAESDWVSPKEFRLGNRGPGRGKVDISGVDINNALASQTPTKPINNSVPIESIPSIATHRIRNPDAPVVSNEDALNAMGQAASQGAVDVGQGIVNAIPTPRPQPVAPAPTNIGEFLVQDKAVGLAEGALTVGSGLASFLTGVPYGIGKTLYDTIAQDPSTTIDRILLGDPVQGLANIGSNVDKYMAGDSAYGIGKAYQPKTETGQYVAGVAASPFTLAHEFLQDGLRDKAWTDSLTQDQKDAIASGKIDDPKAMKEQWLAANPNAGAREGKAATALFDIVLLAFPKLATKVKNRTALTEAEVGEVTSKMIETDPTIPVDVIDVLADKLTKAASRNAKFEANQPIVDALLEGAEARKSHTGKHAQFKRIAKKLEELDVDIETLDLNTIKGVGKTSGKGIRGVIEQAIEDRKTGKTTEAVKSNVEPERFPWQRKLEKIKNDPVKLEAERTKILKEVEALNALEAEGAGLENSPLTDAKKIRRNSLERMLEDLNMEINPDLYKGKESIKPDNRTLMQKIYDQFYQDEVSRADPRTTPQSNYLDKVEEMVVSARPDIADIRKRVDAGEFNSESVPPTAQKAAPVVAPPPQKAILESVKAESPAEPVQVDKPILPATKPLVIPEDGQVRTFADKATAKAEGLEIKLKGRFDSWESVNKRAIERSKNKGIETEVVVIGDKFAVADVGIKPGEAPTFRSLADAEVQYTIARKLKSEQVEVAKDNSKLSPSEYGNVAKIGEDHYIVFKKSVESEKAMREVENQAPSVRVDRFVEKLNEAKVEVVDPVLPTEAPFDRLAYMRSKLAEKKLIATQDAKVADPYLATFKTREDMLDYAAIHDIEGNIVKDKVTGEYGINRKVETIDDLSIVEKDFYPEDMIEFDSSLHEDRGGLDIGRGSDSTLSKMFDLFNDDRGSDAGMTTDLITALYRKTNTIERFVKAAIKSKMDFGAYLESIGITGEMKIAVFKAVKEYESDMKKLAEYNKIVQDILHPENIKGTGSEVVHHGKLKKTAEGVVQNVSITAEIRDWAFKAPKHVWGTRFEMFGKIGESLEIRLNALSRYGKQGEKIWHDWQSQLKKSNAEHKVLRQELGKLREEYTPEEQNRMAIAAYADQFGGKEALKANGVTDIPALTTHEAAGVAKVHSILDNLFERINYVRGNTGVKPIPKTKNYIPMIRNLNKLREMGVVDSMTQITDNRIKAVKEQFTGVLNPFSNKRVKGSHVPIELNIFAATETYSRYALKEIHIAPISAMLKEVANNVKIKVKGKSGLQALKDVNPTLKNLLDVWSDEILGVDPAYKLWAQKNPALAKGISTMQRNLTWSIIGANVGTVSKQPLALVGTFANTGFYNTLHGITKSMTEWGKRSDASIRSEVLDNRVADLMIEQIATEISLGKITGAKKWWAERSLAPMSFVDMITARAGWYAEERYARKTLKLNEKDAIKHADLNVARTHAMGIKGATAPIQSATGLRFITMLQTFAINDFNYIARDLLGIKNPDITKVEQVKKVVRYVAAGSLLAELYSAAGMDGAFPQPVQAFNETMDESGAVPLALFYSMLELAEKVPVIGGISKYGSSAFGALGDFVGSDLEKAITAFANLLDWDSMNDKETKKNLRIVAFWIARFGGVAGTSQFNKSYRAMKNGGNHWEIFVGTYIEASKGGSNGRGSRGAGPTFPPSRGGR